MLKHVGNIYKKLAYFFSFIFRVPIAPGDPSGLEAFPLWLLCGLLPFTFVTNVINQGVSSLVANSGLIQKVYFNRIVLPLSLTASATYNWLFEMGVLLIALLIAGSFVLPWIPLLLAVMILLTIFSAGVGLMLWWRTSIFATPSILSGYCYRSGCISVQSFIP